MKHMKLPLGIDNFKKLREEGFYYVDKTNLILELLHGWGEVNLFTRPRRFGKTLNMSMLKSFFEIGMDPSLFDGLQVSNETELCNSYMGRYPVIFLSLKGIDGSSFEKAERRVADALCEEAQRFSFLLKSDQLEDFDKIMLKEIIYRRLDSLDLSSVLKFLMGLLFKHYSQKVILLIDEYDVPLDKAYQNGYYDEMLDLIRTMFQSALKSNENLYFAVMTGCLRISKESIFTGLNNLKVYSMEDVGFDEYFGFTESEVMELLQAYGLESHHEEIKEWYDGYHFGNQDVYCPWDVMNYCHDLLGSDRAVPKAYWLNSSSNDRIRRLIELASTGTEQREIEQLIDGKSLWKTLNHQLTHDEVDRNIDNLWSLLYMTGYLTLAGDIHNDICELVIPNKEIRQIYIQQVRSWFKQNSKANASQFENLYYAFACGDFKTIEDDLNKTLLETISFHDAYESFYHGFLLALLSACPDWVVTSNLETGKGRSDILVEKRDRSLGIVIEVKSVKSETQMEDACEKAMEQIETKDYVAYFKKYRFKEIWAYGIAFCEKTCRVRVKRILEI